ncbi:lysylphosphatidylglycerol synthase domain-containing protein [Streptomyces sp. NPDC005438]|uniref:lysylphosphatidylglycerol synthase domain-containing protein n=1 Tax=Streptomyces sp. NPDC005438 TaxID=3156880 RepID=UPI0033B299C9
MSSRESAARASGAREPEGQGAEAEHPGPADTPAEANGSPDVHQPQPEPEPEPGSAPGPGAGAPDEVTGTDPSDADPDTGAHPGTTSGTPSDDAPQDTAPDPGGHPGTDTPRTAPQGTPSNGAPEDTAPDPGPRTGPDQPDDRGAHPTGDATASPGTPTPRTAPDPGQDSTPSGGAPGGGVEDAVVGLVAPRVRYPERVESDEPLLAARVHRPSDLWRTAAGLLAIALVLVIAAFAHGTTAGLEEDIDKGAGQAPPLLISIAGFAASVAVLVVPVAFAVERLVKRDGLRIADGVLAAVLAHGASLVTDLWVAEAAPASVHDTLIKTAPTGDLTTPVHTYLAPVIAYMTAVGMARRPRWRVLLWAVLLLDAFAVLVGGYTTPFSIVVTLLIGWTVAYGTLYAVGSPNVQPTGQHLLAGLRRVGFRPVSALRVEEPRGGEAGTGEEQHENVDRGRRYQVTLEDGPPLDVTVVDREQQAQGYFYRAWRRLALRGLTQRNLQSLRQALEQEALLAYAAIAAGANAPRLIATSELGPDAVMLVYEHIGGRALNEVPDEEISDELLRNAWRQVEALQSRRIAHRRLVGEALLVDREGRVFLTDLRGGEIAAGDLALWMDVAQLLTTLGLRVGAVRAVDSAVAVLGPDAVADALPLLQPIALSRRTRAVLRARAKARAQRERLAVLEASRANKERAHTDRRSLRAKKNAEKRALDEALEEAREEDLLAQIRRQVLLVRPQAPVQPARLERIKPRTLVSFIAGALAAYFLATQLSHVEFSQVVKDAEWGWVAAAAVFSSMSYFAAAMSLLGFVPEKVSYLRTVIAQVAASFVKLVAPAAIGGVALNTRFLQRAGVRPGHAVASVGASQLFGLGMHVVLLLAFGYVTGTQHGPTVSPSRTVIAGLLTVAVLTLIVTAIPASRRFVSDRLRSLFAGVVPRILDVLQRPQKLLAGVGGMLLLSTAFVLCLDASIRAFGGELSYTSLAVVFLAGNALGSAAPTPGGLGAVEAALIAGLITFGLPKEIATPAVLLFRLLTFWLPVLPGWLSFTHLTRRGAL